GRTRCRSVPARSGSARWRPDGVPPLARAVPPRWPSRNGSGSRSRSGPGAARMARMTRELHLTGDDAADKLLSDDPVALLVGMLLDQQIAMEVAFIGPRKIADRMDGFDVRKIAEADLEKFVEMCVTPPAIHRYGGS